MTLVTTRGWRRSAEVVRTTRKGVVAVVAALVLTRAMPATAQGTADGAPDPSKVRVKLGRLLLNPTVALTNLGIDTNVFNVAADELPKRDFTLTVVPGTDLWLRMGRTWFSGAIREELVWYQEYNSERAANTRYSLGWTLPFNRLVAKVGATYANVRDRPGFEIDARSQRQELEYNGSVAIRALSKTFFAVTAARQRVDFDKDALFLDSNLHFELNRVTTTGGLTVLHRVTPLTSISLTASRSQDRFEFSSLRDSNSTSASATIALDPFALIKGSASVGYRDFAPVSPGLPSYRGPTAAIDLSYILLLRTRFGLQGSRDVQYSYDIDQPYYVQTGGTATVTQQLSGSVDVVGRIGVQRLDYRDRVGVVIAVSNRTDYVHTFGGGVGYRLGKTTRIGVNIDQQKRTSGISRRQYDGLRFGTSVTYGS